MAEKITFQIDFEANQRQLREVRRQLEQSLKGIRTEFSPEATRTATRGSRAEVVRSGTGGGALQSEISRVRGQIDSATGELIDAIKQRADAEQAIANLVNQTSRFTREDNQELQRLTLVRKSAERRIQDASQAQEQLLPVLKGFEESIIVAGQGLIRSSRETETTLKDGIRGSLNALSEFDRRTRLAAESQNKLSRVTESTFRVLEFTEGALETVGRDATAFTRPIRRLSERSSQLALQFGEAGTNLRTALGQIVGRDIGIDEFRQAVTQAGGDLVGTIARISDVPEELIESSTIFSNVIKKAAAELAEAESAEATLQKDTRDLAASRRRLSQERQQGLQGTFNEVNREQEQQAALEGRITQSRQKILDEQDKLGDLLESQFASETRSARERQRGQQRRIAITPEDLRRTEIVEQATAVVNNLKNAADAVRRARTERIPARIEEIGRAALGVRNEFESNERALTEAGRRISDIDDQLPGADDSQSRQLQQERAGLEQRRAQLIRENNNLLLRELDLNQETAGLLQQQETLEQEQSNIQRQINRAQKDELDARVEAGRRARQSGRGGAGGGRTSISTPQQIESFSRNLDTRGLERFVGILRNTEKGLKAANQQLKAHQGNIARSNNLTEDLTSTLDSGQKAAFQFGFAASNAAERLVAWASPAAFLFQALNLLRQSVTEIVRIDAEIRRVAFFDRGTLDNISQGITNVGEAVFDAGRQADDASGAFGRLSSQAQRLQALNATAAASFDLLGKRALEVGIPLEQLTQLALTAGRVGRGAFDFETGSPNDFFLAAEAALRLEGSAANAEQVVSQLNSVLNQFQIESRDAVTTVALISEAVGDSAFGFQALLDVLARTGGAFRALQGADVAESIETIRFFSERAAVSVGQVSTSIRQLSTGVIRAREEFGLFSEVAQIDREGITSLEGLLTVLDQIDQLRGTPELERFLSLFSERRIQTNIINFSNNVDVLRKNLEELATEEGRVARAQAAVNNLLAQSAFQAQSAQSEVERFNSQLTLFGRAARFDDVQAGLAQFGTQVVSVATALTDAIGGIGPVFAALAGAAAPVLRQIVQGFRAGLIQSQNQQIVLGNITTALGQEKNVIKAVNVAERERLLTAQQANQLRQQGLKIISQEIPINNQLRLLESEKATLERAGLANSVQVEQIKGRINALESQRNALLAQQGNLEQNILTTVNSQSTQIQSGLRRRLPSIIGGAALLGGQLAAQTVGGAFEDKKFGAQISSGISSAIAGGVTGFAVGGPIGAALGAGVGVLGSIVSARQEAARAAEQERVAQEQSNRAAEGQLRVLAAQQEERRRLTEEASKTEAEILDLQEQQQLTQIEIQRIGEERAEQEGLIGKLIELEVGLVQARVRLGQEEEAQLEAKLKFERQIVETRERAQIIETTIATIRDAQISLLEREGDLETVARVKFDFDELSLRSQKDVLEEELSNVSIRIQQLSALGGTQNEQDLRGLNRDRERLANRLNRLEIETVQTRFRNQLAILDASERQTRDTIQRFRQAGDSVAKALADSIKLQGSIADAIREQGEFVNDVLDTQLQRAERALSQRGAGLTEQQRLERQISLQRAFLQQQLNNVNRIFQRQRRTLQETASLDEIEGQVDSVISSLQSLEEAQDATSKSEEIILQEREAIFGREQALLQNQLSAIQNEISARRQNAADIIENARNRIEVEESAIEALQKRIELEEENADRLLDTPEEFLKSIQSVVTARNFVQAIRGRAATEDQQLRQLLRDQRRGAAVDPGELARVREEAFVRQIRRVIETNGVGNRAVLQEVRDGLQEAITQGAVLAEGFSPEELLSVFRRSLVSSADDTNDQVSELQGLNENVSGLLKEIESFTGEQGRLADLQQKLLEQQARVADEQKRLNELQVTELQTQVRTAIQNSSILAEEVKNSANNILTLKDSLETLLDPNTISPGEDAIRQSVDAATVILRDIAAADAQVTEIQRQREEFSELARQLGTRGALTAGTTRQLESELAGARATGGTNLLALGQTGRVTEDFIRDAIGGIIVSALEGGNIGSVGPILQRGGTANIGRDFNAQDLVEFANIFGISAENLATLIDQLEPEAIRAAIEAGGVSSLEGVENTIAAVEAISQDTNTLLAELLGVLPEGSVRLDQLRDILGDRAAGIEGPSIQEQTNAQRQIQQSQEAATIEAIRDNVRTRASLESLVGVVQQLLQQGGASLQNTEAIIGAVNRQLEQRSQEIRETGQVPQLTQLDDASLESLKSAIDVAFLDAGERFKENTMTALEQPLKIEFGEVIVKFNAEILQNIQGEEFAAQITEALTGTGLEDRVGLIQTILSSLVKTELERGNVELPAGALEGIGTQ